MISYLYDGLDAVQETQGGTVNPILTGLGIDERYVRNEASGRAYFLSDALGSTRALTNASGSLIQRYDYTPYGQTSQASAGTTNPYQYTGRERDASGLYYYRARYYAPSLGRFLSEDPIGLAGGVNPYAYVRGRPVVLTDPLGLVDANHVPPGDHIDNYGGMQLIRSRLGELTVGVHFNGENFIGQNYEKWTAQDLAERIKSDFDVSKYDAVTLYSCRAGAELNGNPSPAKTIADVLNIPARATDLYVWMANNAVAPYQGSYRKTPEGKRDNANPGKWIYFYPRSK
ncbi:hypothetical protein NB709_000714 [Xanthomonas sacchari]|nr:hypothetical protein [Xanthomonas sacchari]